MGNPAPAQTPNPALKYQSIEDQLKDPQTQLLLARVLYGEAGSNPDDMRAVLGTVINRARQSGQSIHDVLLSQGQFTSIGPLPGAEGGRRAELEGLGQGGLGPEYNVIQQALDPQKGFDPASGTLRGFNPGINKFYAPKAQEQFHAKYPNIYPEKPSYAVGDPAYSAGGQNFYVSAPYKGGFKIMGDLAGPTGSSTVNQAIAAQDPGGMGGLDPSMFQMNPVDRAAYEKDRAQAQALMPEVLGNIDKMGPVYEQAIQGLEEWQGKANDAYSRYDKTMDSVIGSLPDEHKLQMEELRKVSPDQPGDPHRALTQFLPALVMLGGMFARGGGIGAMKASAAAVNAARSHDDQALERAHQEFQDGLTEAVDKSSMAHEQLGEAITQAGGNQKLLLQKADLLGTELGIPALKQAALNGDANAIMAAFANQSKVLSEAIAWQRAQTSTALADLKMKQIEQQIAQGQPLVGGDLGYAAEVYRLTRQLPSLGIGQAAVATRKAIMAEADKLAQGQETDQTVISSAEAARADVGGGFAMRADVLGLNRLATMRVNIEQAEGTAGAMADELLQQADTATGGNVPILNRWVQAGKKEITGDGEVIQFNENMQNFLSEYAAVMAGQTNAGGRGTTDQARREAGNLLDTFRTPQQVKDGIAQMKENMRKRMALLDEYIANQQQMLPGQGEGSAAEAGYIPGVDTPPVGAAATAATAAKVAAEPPPTPSSAAPTAPPTVPTIQPVDPKNFDPNEWRSDVTELQKVAKEHGFGPNWIKAKLKAKYQFASPKALEDAAEGR